MNLATHGKDLVNPVPHSFSLLLALVALGLAGNYFKFAVLNADFIFGSVFAMLTLQLLGLRSGVLSAAIISSYTFLAWNHPFGILTMTGEVAFVGWVINHRKIDMVAADSLYWVAVGIPVGFICFYFVSHLPPSNALFLMSKQAINGIANCVLARLIFVGYSGTSHARIISFREIASTLMIFFALATGLITLIFVSRSDFSEADLRIRQDATMVCREATKNIENWLKDKESSVINLAGMAATTPPDRMQQILEQLRMSDKSFLRLALVDKEGISIAYSPPIDARGASTIGRSFADRPYIPPLKQKLQPMLSEVMESRFGTPDPVVIMLAPVISHDAYNGYVAGILDLERIRSILETNATRDGMKFSLVDRNGAIILTSRKDQNVMAPFSFGNGDLQRLDSRLAQWIPELTTGMSTIELWGKSFYVVESQVGKLAEWKLIVEQPVAPFQKMLYDSYSLRFLVLFVVVVVLLILAEFLSRRMVSTIQELAVITLDLPSKLESQRLIVWPDSMMLETNSLICNFRQMADSLLAKFREIRQINETLDQLVKERTRELETSQDKLSNAVKIARLGHWDYDVKNDSFTFNDQFYKLFHTTVDEVGSYKMSFAQYSRRFVHPDDVPGITEELRKAKESNDPDYSQQFHHRMFYADGAVGYFAVRLLINHDSGGRTVKIYGVNQDITENEQAQEALRESEEKFKQIFESANVGKSVTLPTGEMNVNKAFCDLLGYTQEELKNKKWQDLTPAEDIATIQEFLDPLLKGDQNSARFNKRYIHKDGSYIWADVSCAIRRDKSGKAQHFITTIVDITDRLKAQETQRRLAAAIYQVTDGIMITDRDGNIEYVNPAIEAMTGYSSEELMGNKPSILKSGEQDPAFYENLWNIITSGDTWSGQFTNRRKDGSLYHADTTIAPVVDESGKIANFVMVKRDVTEKLELSRQLLQAQKMEALGTLAGGIAHDFNNLLQVVLGYSEILLGNKKSDDPERDGLQKIHSAAQRGTDLVRNLLTFSRKLEPNLRPVDLKKEVAEIEKLFFRTIPKNIKIVVRSEDKLKEIMADTSQIGQILMNLAVNARDAMPDGGVLTIEAQNIELGDDFSSAHPEVKPGPYVLLTVTDTGHGMDPQTVDRIFDPFFTTKELGKGTGLGLATVHGIVKQHQGCVTCSSQKAKGTIFKIYFPAIEREEHQQTVEQFTVPAGENQTILVVDDDEIIRNLGRLILTSSGYQCLEAADGKEALRIYKEYGEKISLVLLDINMPEMDGLTCLKELLKLNPKVKALICTGLLDNFTEEGAIESGAMGLVSKPYSLQNLLTRIHEILEVS